MRGIATGEPIAVCLARSVVFSGWCEPVGSGRVNFCGFARKRLWYSRKRYPQKNGRVSRKAGLWGTSLLGAGQTISRVFDESAKSVLAQVRLSVFPGNGRVVYLAMGHTSGFKLIPVSRRSIRRRRRISRNKFEYKRK